MVCASQLKPSEVIRGLVCGYPAEIRVKRLMLMLHGFADDSGSDGNRAPFFLAGWVLNAQGWEAFSDDWHSQLNREPKIEYFHMKEAAGRQGQFMGMPKEFILCKIHDLLSVLDRHNPDGLYSYVTWPDYRDVVQPKVSGMLRNPYQVLFPGIFDALLIYQRNKGIYLEQTDFDFDEQGEAGRFAQIVFRFTKENAPDIMKPLFGRMPMMLDDKNVMPLQAADMLAWNYRREFDPEDTAKEWHWLYERLFKHVWLGVQFTRISLEALLKTLPPEQG